MILLLLSCGVVVLVMLALMLFLDGVSNLLALVFKYLLAQLLVVVILVLVVFSIVQHFDWLGSYRCKPTKTIEKKSYK